MNKPSSVAGSRILLVDDELELLEMLHDWLVYFGFAVKTSNSALGAIALFKEEPFDVVVTDLKMPGLDGLQLLSMLKELDETVEVIFLTGQGTMEDAVQALRGGRAFDFLQKPLRDLHKLNQVIEQAIERRKAAEPRRTSLLPVPEGIEPLTERENEIIACLAQGMDNREIAERLVLSDKTVKNHLSRIYDKLRVSNRTQAVILCQQLGVIR
jgi:DNA-binding NarL/FixJ family response regulator